MAGITKINAKSITGKVVKIAELLDYQPGAVVSREIIRKDVGTVTVFAFDKGQGLSEHTAPFDALIFVVDGAAEVRIAGKKMAVAKGGMVIMPANIPHAVTAKKRFKMVLVMIRA